MKVTCLCCKQDFMVGIEPICWPCHPLNKMLQQQTPKKSFWREAKRFSYHSILYLPPAYFLGIHYGFSYEMAWIAGSIYISIIPSIRDWLMSKF